MFLRRWSWLKLLDGIKLRPLSYDLARYMLCGLGFITVSHIRWTCFLTKSCQWYCCCGAYPASGARAAVGGGPVGRGVESVWHEARWPWAQMQCQDGQYELLTYWPHKAVADVSRRGSQWEGQVKWDNVMVWMMMMMMMKMMMMMVMMDDGWWLMMMMMMMVMMDDDDDDNDDDGWWIWVIPYL